MTNPARFYIYAQICDVTTTVVGVRLGCYEASPLGLTTELLVAKLVMAGIVVLILDLKMLPTYLAWLPTTVASLIVIWNIVVIGMQIWL